MLSSKYCRKFLPPDNKLSDEDLATLCEQLYCLANLALDVRQNSRRLEFGPIEIGEIEQDSLEERAAIIEFEANTARDEAEKRAIQLALENEHLN